MNDKYESEKFSRKAKRGVAAVIGGVILVAILLTTALVFFITMLNNEQARSSYEIQYQQENRDKETETYIVYREPEITGGSVEVKISNTGSIPMVASRVLLYCSSGAGCVNSGVPIQDIDVKTTLPNGKSQILNPGDSISITVGGAGAMMDLGNTYTISVISERGNIVSSITCTVEAGGTCSEDSGGDTGDGGGDSSPETLHSSLIKPEIFLIAPGPFGEGFASSQRGVWGIVVANPSPAPMDVSRIVINAFVPHDVSSQKFFEFSNCPITPIYPNVASEWACIADNQVEWKDVSAPEIINPNAAKSFLAKIEPGNIGASKDEPAVTLSVTVFTNFGQFTKVGHASSQMQKDDGPIANVYLTTTTTPATALTSVLGHLNGNTGGDPVTMNIAVVDFDTNNAPYIKSGTKLIVNIPRDFTGTTVTSSTGFTSADITDFPDGSAQIVAVLQNHVGDQSSAEAVVLAFDTTAPPVTKDKLYVFYSLLDGQTNDNFSVGALAEIVVQVIP